MTSEVDGRAKPAKGCGSSASGGQKFSCKETCATGRCFSPMYRYCSYVFSRCVLRLYRHHHVYVCTYIHLQVDMFLARQQSISFRRGLGSSQGPKEPNENGLPLLAKISGTPKRPWFRLIVSLQPAVCSSNTTQATRRIAQTFRSSVSAFLMRLSTLNHQEASQVVSFDLHTRYDCAYRFQTSFLSFRVCNRLIGGEVEKIANPW